jgi:hypothetical protein
MRAKEKQEKNLHIARGYANLDDMVRIIEDSGVSKEDQKTAISILNTTDEKKSLESYWTADTAIRDLVQDAFEESYYGITADKKALMARRAALLAELADIDAKLGIKQ